MAQAPKTREDFKPLTLAKSSNIPVLGRTTFMAHIQKAAVPLASSNSFPKLAAFMSKNTFAWIKTYFKGAFIPKYKPYPGYAAIPYAAFPAGPDSGIYTMHAENGGAAIKLSIVGDWGSGTYESWQVAESMKQFAPDYTIHLGDVYYVGDDQEVKENFLGTSTCDYTPVSFPKGAVGTLTMVGNHEMYGGGAPYFTEMLAYCSPEPGQKQKASFFCLETPEWRIIGLDTGYNSVGRPILGQIPGINKIPWVGANCALQNELLTWLRTNVDPQKNKKPTLLLSHHQYFTAYTDEAFARPAQQLKEFFAGQEVVWVWGHEHRLSIYEKYSPDGNITCYGRCLGHGGMPVECKPPANQKVPLQLVDPRWTYPLGDGSKVGWNGFLNMTIEGETITLDYRDLKNRPLFVESFTGKPDGTLTYACQTPPAVLTPPTDASTTR